MVYIPRSKISKKHISSDNVFIIKSSGAPFKGNYIKTSDGKFFAGHSNSVIGPELVKTPIDKPNTLSPKRFSNSKLTRTHKNLRPDIKNKLEKTTSIPIKKPLPTILNYKLGFFQRYFFKRINNDTYLETDKSVYDNLLEKKPIYDFNLYEVGTLIWYLKGNDVYKKNANSIKQAEIKYKNIEYLFPILNEYQISSPKVEENLNTKGGELYYSDGKEYIGFYHIHPSKGPMVGAKHTAIIHDNLYYTKNLPKIPNQSYEEFNKNYNKITCYKCVESGKHKKVIMKKRSRLLGCPANTFTSYDEAANACLSTNIKTNTSIDKTDNTTTSYGSSGTSGGSGGGTSSSGGGGY